MENPSSQKNLKLTHCPIVIVLDAQGTDYVESWSGEGDAQEASLLCFKVWIVFLAVWKLLR